MRLLLFLLVFAAIRPAAHAQSISYDIPEGYEKYISKADYRLLVDSSVAIVAKRCTILSVKAGTILTKDQGDMNLHNLIVKCAQSEDRNAWMAIVHDHFNSFFASQDERKKIDPANFESVRKYLSLRIYRAEDVKRWGNAAQNDVTRTDLEGTLTVLMFDLPGAFSSVEKQMFKLWKKDTAEVFAVALANISQQQVEKETHRFKAGNDSIDIGFIGDENYAASYALDLVHNSPEMVGEWGCAITIPNKGLVEICKISREKAVDFVLFIQMTKPSIEQAYREHPQPVSDQYFWYYHGTFTHIDVFMDAKGNVSVTSPAGLTGLMTPKE